MLVVVHPFMTKMAAILLGVNLLRNAAAHLRFEAFVLKTLLEPPAVPAVNRLNRLFLGRALPYLAVEVPPEHLAARAKVKAKAKVKRAKREKGKGAGVGVAVVAQATAEHAFLKDHGIAIGSTMIGRKLTSLGMLSQNFLG